MQKDIQTASDWLPLWKVMPLATWASSKEFVTDLGTSGYFISGGSRLPHLLRQPPVPDLALRRLILELEKRLLDQTHGANAGIPCICEN
jgi:hypothetical protein